MKALIRPRYLFGKDKYTRVYPNIDLIIEHVTLKRPMFYKHSIPDSRECVRTNIRTVPERIAPHVFLFTLHFKSLVT